jgi:hypothetical protein
MSERENALLRWARLKQKAKAAEGTDSGSAGPEPVAAAESQFDPASLPSVESIVADTDIMAFLRAGVPAELTRAALRRAWASDPAIRDFIGIAENQWDFNDPNGIAGFGPIGAAESGVDMFAQISGRLERHARMLEDLAAMGPTIPSNANTNAPGQQLVVNNPPLVDRNTAPRETAAAAEDENTPMVNGTQKTRRHGSALPR